MKSVFDPRSVQRADLKGRKPAGDQALAKAHAAARLEHAHLIALRPSAGDPQQAFEPDLAGGERLSEICRKRFSAKPAPLAFGLRILLDALSGLAALHGGALCFAH